MSRLLALAVVVSFVSVSSAGVNVAVVHITCNQPSRGGPVSFGSATSFGSPSLGLAGFPGGSLNPGNTTRYMSPFLGQNFVSCGTPGGSCNLLGASPFCPGNCGQNFGSGVFPNSLCNSGCAPLFGTGFCGPNVGGFGWPPGPNGPWATGSFHFRRFSHDTSVYYAPWYDQGYGWSWPGSAANYGNGFSNFPTYGMLFSEARDKGFVVPAPPRPQVINFPTPLEKGKAQIKIEPPAAAEVLVNGQPIGARNANRVFTTPVINGPTNYDVKVRQTIKGKVDEQTFRVTVKPGDRQQITVLR